MFISQHGPLQQLRNMFMSSEKGGKNLESTLACFTGSSLKQKYLIFVKKEDLVYNVEMGE